MESMIACCGLNCETCPIHLATIESNPSRQKAMRVSIAEQCSTYYGIKQLAEDINDCDGCRADSHRLFSGCSKCEIRKCALAKKLESCAYCTTYPCEILKKHFILDPSAESRLQEIRQRN
jgi:hypothetical protein